MVPGILKLVGKSLSNYKRPVLYQVLIISLLSAVITGSLLTGRSVKSSLRKSATERLGNTGIMISSGTRYFDSSLAEKLGYIAKVRCTGLLEINGYCKDLVSQKEAFNTKIYALTPGFFAFQNKDTVTLESGNVAVNEKLASYLGLKAGDELIIRVNDLNDIPADAPFAPDKDAGKSLVMKVGSVLTSENAGNFSLSISQVMPMNIFINLSDILGDEHKTMKINRLLLENNSFLTDDEVYDFLKQVLVPSDIGLSIVPLVKTGENELRSDRIFIEEPLISEIKNIIPSSAPVITYLGNSFRAGSRSTPYSFVSGLPSSLYPDVSGGENIIINRWLAEDLEINEGDTLQMFWYSPDSLNSLIEKNSRFCVRRVVDMTGIWSDSLLMPEFPGISGSESCSDWDAGVQIKLGAIRQKDEEYWNRFRGTPKAFINYEKGKALWGNNFGPATGIRFPKEISGELISERLSGSIDPGKTGFHIINLSEESIRAANGSVDFSTLLLSLGFFLIMAAVVLLSLAVNAYLDSKQSQIRIYFALGFRTSWIGRLFFAESALIAIIGCFLGSIAGVLVNILLINLLNTVWQGAVQTDTLDASFSILPVLSGFMATLIMALIFLGLQIRLFLTNLNREKKLIHTSPSQSRNLIFLLISFFVSAAFFSLSLFIKDSEILYSFASGSVLMIFMILSWRQYIIHSSDLSSDKRRTSEKLSLKYYSYYPLQAITPVLFIATGIFAVFITGSNRMNMDSKILKNSGGTGGYLLWCESSIPVMEDITTSAGLKALGLDDAEMSDLSFVQMKRSAGDDASCLNLNHITAPPLLGVDPSDFIARGSFSFAKSINEGNTDNPWQFLDAPASDNIVFGIADQTVLQWGLKIKTGDTLIMKAENGQILRIIIAAGLKSSVFQGHVLIGMENFRKFYPSVSGSSVFLTDGNQEMTEIYKETLLERLDNYGINAELTTDRLASYYEVTNTYLTVFGVFGALGLVIGIAGLGFVLLRNYNFRKREFALMLATGFAFSRIRKIILSEQMIILCAGIISGMIPAFVATLPSLKNNQDIPWIYLLIMITIIFMTGASALYISVRSVTDISLTESLKKE